MQKYVLAILFLLSSLYRCNGQDISASNLKVLERLANKGELTSIDELIDYYRRVTIHQDVEKAIEWAKKGIALNDSESMYQLGLLVGNKKEQWFWVTKAAKKGCPEAMTTLSLWYTGMYGDFGHANNDSSFFWINKAIEGGDEEAYLTAGNYFYTGIGTKINYNTALYYYKKGCNKDIYTYVESCDSVVSIYKRGLVICNDTLEYRYWREKRKELEIPLSYK